MSKLLRLKSRLEDYYAAETAILAGQEYWIRGLRLRRADLQHIQSMIDKLEGDIDFIESGGKNRTFRVVPFD